MFKYAQKEYHTQNKSDEKKKSLHLITNIPMQMKRHFEDLSGLSFDNVRVNYNSGKPAQPLVHKTPYDHNGSVVQLYSEHYGYTSTYGHRYMQCDIPDRGFDDLPVKEPKNDLAILYEVIVYDRDAEKVINRFKEKFTSNPCRDDVALSLVANHKVGDENINRGSLISTNVTNNPLITVERVIWGKQDQGERDNPGRHPAQEEIPYYSLRRRAAINQGAMQLENLLKKNSDHVWRKMCDSDAVFHDPRDPEDKQMTSMKEKSSEEFSALKMITFGYILETPDNDYDTIIGGWFRDKRFTASKREEVKNKIKQKLNKFIDLIYQYEAEFRERLNPIMVSSSTRPNFQYTFNHYPCEPSTYYRFRGGDSEDDIKNNYWTDSPTKQIAEGHTFKEHFIADNNAYCYVSKADTLERTGAGVRHKEFISEFFKEGNINYDSRNKRIVFIISRVNLYAQIKKLSQSYFNPSTHGITSHDPGAFNVFDGVVDRFLDRKGIDQELQKNEYIVRW